MIGKLREGSLEDTLLGETLAWRDQSRRQSKRAKDFTDIVRLVEAHLGLWDQLGAGLQELIEKP